MVANEAVALGTPTLTGIFGYGVAAIEQEDGAFEVSEVRNSGHSLTMVEAMCSFEKNFHSS